MIDDVDNPTTSGDAPEVNAVQATPPEVNAGTADVRLIRWTGEPPRKKRVRDRKTGEIREVIDFSYEPNRDAPYGGVSTKSMRAGAVPGLSRTYHWGPLSPHLAEVLAADWEALSADTNAARLFTDVTGDAAYDGRPRRRLDDPLHPRAVAMLKRMGITS